jgi:hypothetical protein
VTSARLPSTPSGHAYIPFDDLAPQQQQDAHVDRIARGALFGKEFLETFEPDRWTTMSSLSVPPPSLTLVSSPARTRVKLSVSIRAKTRTRQALDLGRVVAGFFLELARGRRFGASSRWLSSSPISPRAARCSGGRADAVLLHQDHVILVDRQDHRARTPPGLPAYSQRRALGDDVAALPHDLFGRVRRPRPSHLYQPVRQLVGVVVGAGEVLGQDLPDFAHRRDHPSARRPARISSSIAAIASPQTRARLCRRSPRRRRSRRGARAAKGR